MAEFQKKKKTESWETMIIKLLIAGTLPDGLVKLPQEVRDRIYGEVFAAGYTALTCVCKAMYDDTKEALSKHGIYRVRMGQIKSRQHWYNLHHLIQWQFTEESLANIRNLDLLVSPNRSHLYASGGIMNHSLAEMLPGLLGLMRNHTHCQVRLESVRYRNIDFSDVACLRLLRKFESVTVELRYCPMESSKKWTSDVVAPDSRDGKAAVTAVEAALETSAGKQDGKPRLEFIWSE